MAKPWVDGGYRVVLVDPQHITTRTEGSVERIAGTLTQALSRLGEIIRTEPIAFVAGFPPCTDVAVSGARWFSQKEMADKHFQTRAALVAEQCRVIGSLSGAPWMFENPVSVFSSIFGDPDYTFNPCDYTGHCADDNYTKKTCLWVGNGFAMPPKNKRDDLGPPDDRMHKAPPGPDRANFRSATPKGFAMAVYLANAR